MPTETKEVMVCGTAVTLERRVCERGCMKHFWVLPTSKSRLARAWCDYSCKKGMTINHPNPRALMQKLERRDMAGLSERQEDIYEKVVGKLERVAAEGSRISIREVVEEFGLKPHDWANTWTKVRTLEMSRYIKRYTDAMEIIKAAARATVALVPDEPEEEEETEEEPEEEDEEDEDPPAPPAAKRTGPAHVVLYDDVQLRATANMVPEIVACRQLGYDYGEYLAAKARVESAQKKQADEKLLADNPKSAVWTAAVAKGVEQVLQKAPPRTEPAPAPVPGEVDTAALLAVIQTLRPLPPDVRTRVLAAASAFF